MQRMAQRFNAMTTERPEFERIDTTLWELVETLNEEIRPDEENLLALIVSHMLDSTRSVSLLT
jgi:hypothetical protein